MKKGIVIAAVVILAIFLALWISSQSSKNKKDLVVGTANPGFIKVFDSENGTFKQIKNINTGYKYVWTVRIGDIFNNGKRYIIAGVSDSLYGKSYTCKVIGYDLENYKKFQIDEVDNFRCKDLQIGDADNDGKNDIILITHGQGLIRMYSWISDKWHKEDLENNYIAQVDNEEGTNHRVPNAKLPCPDCIVQTADHTSQIGDVDNDGKNEVVVSQSSPLELSGVPEIGFVKVFKKTGNKWKSQVIDKISDIEVRGLYIADIYNNHKNAIVTGTGTPRQTPAGVYAYEYKDNKWNKRLVYSNGIEKNMKAMAVGDIFNDGVNRIVFSTGMPDDKTFIATWTGSKFKVDEIASASKDMHIKDAQYNSMAVVLNKTGDTMQIINGGFVMFPKSGKGAEASDQGYLKVYTQKNGSWNTQVIDKGSIWAVDIN